MKVTILNDNRSSGSRFVCEHGLSVLLQWDGKSLLLDTGQTDKYVKNAEALHIDLSAVDACVLSHGHYDHSGGLAYLDRRIPIYIGKGATQVRYSLSSVMKKANGMPRPEILREFEVHEVEGVLRLDDEVTLFALPEDAPANPHLVVDGEKGGNVPDRFGDEIFTLVRTGGCTLLFGGCTHHGLEQLLAYVREHLGVEKLSAFVGGLHLSGQPAEVIAQQADAALRHLHVERWIVNHCTGAEALMYWRDRFGALDGYSGTVIEIAQ